MPSSPVMAIDNAALGGVETDDGTIPLAIAGGGPSLMLLHGWTLDHRMWQPQTAALGRHFRLVMPDRRGFGRSTAPPDLAHEAGDIARIADALGLDRFALAGISQGAGVALDFAIRFPDRLTALALVGTPLPGLVAQPDNVPREEYTALVRQGALAELRRRWAGHPLMQVGSAEGEELLAAILADYDGRDLLHPSSLPEFSRDAIAAMPVPLLAIAGGQETAWRIACARLLAETAPLGEFLSVPQAGHLANIAQPEAFNQALRDFFTAHPQFPS